MLSGIDALFLYLPETVIQLVFGVLLGLFMGLEREWSNKPSGIRTVSLLTVLGVVFAMLEMGSILIGMGVVFVITITVLLGVKGFFDEKGLSLTTSVSLLVAYSVGLLVGFELYIEAITVAVLSSLLLLLKEELHSFAGALSQDELQSAIEFAIIAFLIYPLLPSEPIDPWNAINPQLVWALVIAVSGIGFANYILVRKYDSYGFIVTGFIGGLVNSTAVIASMAKRARNSAETHNLAVGAIILANSAMSLRNAVIAILFVPALIVEIGVPLLIMCVSGVGLAVYQSNLDAELDTETLESPFSLKNALVFGGLFVGLLIVSTWAETQFGSAGFILVSFLGGIISSGSTTTTAVVLLSSESIPVEVGVAGILAGIISSILVKVVFAAFIDRSLIKPVVIYNTVLLLAGVVTFGVVLYIL